MKKIILVLLIILLFFVIWHDGHIHDCLIYYSQPMSTISYIAVTLTAIFIAYQAKQMARQSEINAEQSKLLLKDYDTRLEHAEREKAYKLAGYYAKNILPRMIFANKFLYNINLKIIGEEFYSKSSQFKKFTKVESEKVFNRVDIVKLFRREMLNPKNVPVNFDFMKFLEMNNLNLYWGVKKETVAEQKDRANESMTKIELPMEAIISGVTYILNDIEYFSMYFSSGLADANSIYMVIHQTYLEFVRNAYLLFCLANSKIGHEYYAHTIKLYNMWTEESNKRDIDMEKKFSPEEPHKVVNSRK